jgi:hypothetical protein
MIAAAALLALGGGGAWLFLTGRGAEKLQVTTSPEQAQIYVDGKLQEALSPTVIALRPGAKVRIERKGFQPRELAFVPGQPLPKVDLEPVIGPVLIESVPAGATVNIDGQAMAEVTPVTIAWNQSKKVRLTLSKGQLGTALDYEPGETPQGQILKLVAEGEKQQIIDARSDGTLKLAGSFAVRAKVDGKDIGELNASSQVPLPPGKHRVELSSAKVFYKATHSVQIQAGQVSTISLPGVASIQIETFPGSAMILIDGQPTGVESLGDTAITLTKGTHVIGFVNKTTKQTVEVSADGKLPRIKL